MNGKYRETASLGQSLKERSRFTGELHLAQGRLDRSLPNTDNAQQDLVVRALDKVFGSLGEARATGRPSERGVGVE
jgi:hypothetical protein